MYPFRRILIPTDFSTAAEWAFDYAVRIAAATGAEVIILHIRMTWGTHPSELRLPADPSVYEYAEQQELALLRKRAAEVHAAISTRLVVKQAPSAGREICSTAREEKADLIVIATHARHHVAHLLVGSTTLAVVNDPPAPVLAIRYGITKRESMRRIVVPVHPKQKSRGALDLAGAVAEHERGEVHLLTVCRDDERSAAEALQNELASRFPAIAITRAVIGGTDVQREIIRYAAKVNADIIFLNADQQLGEKKIDIVRHAPTPVMVIPPNERSS
jgi:nucleotide-binding universal stress UspA family protein